MQFPWVQWNAALTACFQSCTVLLAKVCSRSPLLHCVSPCTPLQHTPTLIEAYVAKAKFLKHAGESQWPLELSCCAREAALGRREHLKRPLRSALSRPCTLKRPVQSARP